MKPHLERSQPFKISLSTPKCKARGITAGYSPPEQYGVGATDARTDIYSLGATLYTLLTGAVPPESVDLIAGIAKPPVAVHVINPQVPSELSEAIQHAMQLDANKPFPTAGDFKAAIYSAIPTMSWAGIPPRAGAAGAPPLPQASSQENVNLRPPSTPPAGDNHSLKTPSQPTHRPGWALFGFVGCLVILIMLLVGGIGLWGLYTYTDALAFLKPPTSTLTPTPTLTSTPTLPPTLTPTATSTPTITPTPLPTYPPRLTPPPVFVDDFSNPSSGWDRVNLDNTITDYQDGYYRIWVKDPNMDIWANPSLYFADTIVEVDTYWISGTYDTDFGIICRYQDTSNFYFAVISSDGYAAVIHMLDGSYTILGADALQPYPAIVQGDALNHIRFDCVGDTLTLYVNGQRLITVSDPSLKNGDLGLIAGTYDEGGVEIFFDNFIVFQP